MKNLLFSILLILVFCSQTNAQNNGINITNITPITKQEFLLLKNVTEGDIVLIKDEGTLFYYSGKQWYVLKGECYPKPTSPIIDSVVLIVDKINVYFNDQNSMVQKYVVACENLSKHIIVSNSPAIFEKPNNNGLLYFTVRGKTECDTASPVSMFPFEFKEE